MTPRNTISKLKVFLLPIVLLALPATILAGCGQSATAPAAPEPDYAGAITDTTLKGLSDDNLEEYTRYGNAEFKAAVTQEVLDETSLQVKSQLGTYKSKEYLSTETQDSLTIVHYKTKFSKGEIGVRMVFDADHLVAGQWFEQPGS
jgi:hypothetical protein